ncbi:MAG: peptidogalycan biosysnthesis protein, partial [Pseudolabrys sp.]
MTDVEVRIRIAQSLAEVKAAAWNTCAAQSDQRSIEPKHEVKLTPEDNSSPEFSTREQLHNPFVSYEFLSALEESGAVAGRTGWQPRYLLA